MLYICLVFLIILWLQVLPCRFQNHVECPSVLVEWGWWTAFPQVGFNKKLFFVYNPYKGQSFQIYWRSSSLGNFHDWEQKVFSSLGGILYFPFIFRLEKLVNGKQVLDGLFWNNFLEKKDSIFYRLLFLSLDVKDILNYN